MESSPWMRLVGVSVELPLEIPFFFLRRLKCTILSYCTSRNLYFYLNHSISYCLLPANY